MILFLWLTDGTLYYIVLGIKYMPVQENCHSLHITRGFDKLNVQYRTVFVRNRSRGFITLAFPTFPEMTDLEQYLQSYFEFSQTDLAKVAGFFKPEMVKKGEYYLKSGKLCKKLSFVQSGLLRVYVDLEDREVTQWISTKGYFLTDLASLIFEKPSRWNIQALADTAIYTIQKEDYDRLADYVPRWPVTEKLFIAHCFTTLEDRVFSFLSMTAEQRYNILFESNRELFNQVPLQYIASMLGMTPETFSRIRRKQLI